MTVDYVTESGLLVTDRRSRAAFPRDMMPNDNPAEGTVGPDSSTGFGNTHVMYDGAGVPPPGVQAWSGWPVEWATPRWGQAIGLDAATRRSATVFAAADMNAQALATMPPYRLRGGEIVDPVDWMINPQPDVYSDWSDAMAQVVLSLFVAGEAFLWATSRNRDDTVRSWVMLDPNWVNVRITGQIRTYEMLGQDITADVLHIRYWSWPGVPHGIGPLESAATNLYGVEAMERYAADLTMRGGIPWGVLTSPGPLTGEQAIEARAQWVAARMSAMGAPAVLGRGITLAPFTFNPKDMALLELRGYEEARLATVMRCPPTLLGLPTGDSMTYKNVEGVYDFHWRVHLRPVANRISASISQWALARGQVMELDDDEYTRPALDVYATTLATLVDAQIMTVDEARAALRFNASSRRATSLSVGAT